MPSGFLYGFSRTRNGSDMHSPLGEFVFHRARAAKHISFSRSPIAEAITARYIEMEYG